MIFRVSEKILALAVFGKFSVLAQKGPGPIQIPNTEDFDEEEKTNTPSYT